MDIQISITGRIAFEPRFFPVSNNAPAMWSATLEVNGPPTPGRDGSAYIPTRHVEVVTYGVAAIRAHESYRKGHVIVVQGCDLLARTYETKDRANKPIARAVIKVTATAIGLCSRYTAVQEGHTSWPPAAAASPRLVQGATVGQTDLPAAA
jgi:single-stranded DNA-binding protein